MLFRRGSLWRLNELGWLPKLARISFVSGVVSSCVADVLVLSGRHPFVFRWLARLAVNGRSNAGDSFSRPEWSINQSQVPECFRRARQASPKDSACRPTACDALTRHKRVGAAALDPCPRRPSALPFGRLLLVTELS